MAKPLDILVVGSTALDSVETGAGAVNEVLGGSAFYFSAAASFFAPVGLVGVVGGDFPLEELDFLERRGVDLEGLEVVSGGKTFRWGGKYHANMNDRDTLFTHLNVFEDFQPRIPETRRNSRMLFLANIQPRLQLDVLNQMREPEVVVTDTMNLWIRTAPEELRQVIARTDILIVNDEESEMITGLRNHLAAARSLLRVGPGVVIVKKGEHGALMVGRRVLFHAPAMPLEEVVDPTGAGDTFAGGFVGSLALDGLSDEDSLRRAVVRGTALASFCVQDFSVSRLARLTRGEIDGRVKALRELTEFGTG